MKNIECFGTDCPARSYCLALKGQGVEIFDGSSDCAVPGMYKEDVNGDVSFTPVTEGELDKPELVSMLGGKILEQLTDNESSPIDSPEISDLLEGRYKVFSARMNLWKSMIGATREGRKLTDIELIYYENEIAEASEALSSRRLSSPDQELNNRVLAQAIFDHKTLEEHGLLFDNAVTETVDRLVGNLMDGKPTLVVGEKGIAKTQACKFAARLWDNSREPIVISGHGDMTSSEFMGQVAQDKETGRFVFKNGKLVQAMKEGRPVIIDEINVGDQTVMLRLQDILLQRPGTSVVVQENGDEEIVIQPGFTVMATANEASEHYQHRNVLESAFRSRYDVLKLGYADIDNDNPLDNTPVSLMRLALAGSINNRGKLSSHIKMDDLTLLVKLANITQHLFTRPARDVRAVGLELDSVTTDYLNTSSVLSDCITPRSVYDTVSRCTPGNKPGVSLKLEIQRLIAGLDQSGNRNSKIVNRILELLSHKRSH